MKLDLRQRISVVMGLHMTGKTYLTRWLAKKYKSIAYDVYNDFEDVADVYIPEYNAGDKAQQEHDLFLNEVMNGKLKNKYNMLIIDEATRYYINRHSLLTNQYRLINEYRHYNLGVIFVTRRPSDITTSIIELARYLFIFRLTGRNDLNFLDDIKPHLSDIVSNLNEHEFYIVDAMRNVYGKFKLNGGVIEQINSQKGTDNKGQGE